MPVTLADAHPAPLSAPLSRRDDAVVLASPYWACLVHGQERCPVAVPFVWETGQPVTSLAGAVAA
ncbi:hypothetical protein [Streptomyces nigra]|uniref:Uncharacterized protein n=1 Tax=Streptomyces nigra TaxID=1827580 RepID=A0ABZ1J3P8_9ACTN